MSETSTIDKARRAFAALILATTVVTGGVTVYASETAQPTTASAAHQPSGS